ncbi:MAG TPA: tetratricopeptide repeat-containing diguanylate cyclase [Longimicrobium sp.]|uniref:GGDEF domain-containing protein n=1 Tax=Longimicrobium sp. TaxID=2029185 RepID=UPI002ED9B9CE
MMRSIPLLALLPLATAAAQPAPRPRTPAELVAAAEVMPAARDDSARAMLERAIARLGAPGDRQVRARAIALRCWKTAGSIDEARLAALAEAGLAEATRAGNGFAIGMLRLCRGYARESLGQVDSAAADYEFGITSGRRLNDTKLLANALMLRGDLNYYRGDFAAALADLGGANAGFAAVKDGEGLRRVLNSIANVYADRRVAEYDRAIEYYRQVLASNQAANDPAGISTAYFNIGRTTETKGDPAAALEYYQRSLEIERRRGDPGEVAYVQSTIGGALTKLGRAAEGLRWMDQALAHFARAGDVANVAYTRLPRAVALRTLGRPAEALADLDVAAAYFQSTGSTRFLEKVRDEQAQSLAAVGNWRAAYEARAQQLELQKKLADQFREEQTSRLRVQFDSEKKEAENRALTRENQLRGQALAFAGRVRRLQTIVIALGVGIMAVLAFLMMRHIAGERRMREMAMTDELTRIPNRRALLALAGEGLRNARSRHEPFSLLALDVDHFKRINDTFGHDVGDSVLRRVAQACRGALREGDAIGRTGGEEFIVVLPRADARQAVDIAERLRGAVEALQWSDLDPALHVTVSVGVAERAAADDSFAALSRRADDSLYRAKERGRNRVVAAM